MSNSLVVWPARCWSGLLAAPESVAINGVAGVSKGLFYGGGFYELDRKRSARSVSSSTPGIVTLIIALILKYTIGLRLSPEAEAAGIE